MSRLLTQAYNEVTENIMTISVCLIVKNEEKVIERCLKSIALFADEIIVTDTGSSDKTKEITSKFTDKIFDFEWINDFSAARNFCFSKATSDMIFWLDADDVVLKEDAEKINKIKSEKNPADTYMMKYYAAVDENYNPIFEYYRERLMKRCKYAHFNGFVHECVSPFGKIVFSDIKVIHDKLESSSPTRNLDIYEYHIKNGAILNAREQYYYAKEFFYLGNYKKCFEELEKFLALKNIYCADEWDALLSAYICSEKIGQKDGEKFLFSALEKFGPDSKTLCFLGDYYRKNLAVKKAENYYKMAVFCEGENNGFFREKKYEFLEPCLRLVKLNYECGNYEKAKVYHNLCKKFYPSDKSVMYNDKFFS